MCSNGNLRTAHDSRTTTHPRHSSRSRMHAEGAQRGHEEPPSVRVRKSEWKRTMRRAYAGGREVGKGRKERREGVTKRRSTGTGTKGQGED